MSTQVDPFEKFRLDGRVALVTGASSGMGARFAQVLHDAGATVALCARRADRLKDVASSLERSVVIPCDVSKLDECERVVETALAECGQIDILVNNAATAWTGPAESEPNDAWQDVIAVNLHGPFWLAQLAGRDMLARGSGVVVNVASIMGMVALGNPPQTSYRASKAALVNLTRELAVQWATRGVRVNALCPGFFRTEMTQEMFDSQAQLKWLQRRTPMERGGEVEELDGAILFLASDASSYMTGATLVIDGGYTAI